MKIVGYNINGIRASVKLGLLDWMKQFNADVYCLQEVRCNEELTKELVFGNYSFNLFDEVEDNKLVDYYPVYNCGKVAGYAGTLTLSKNKPDQVFYDMGEYWQDEEGRTTTIIIGEYAIVNAYIPNGNSRLEFKMKYLEALNKYLNHLMEEYKVICVGDYNIAFVDLLNIGLVDSFRYLNPNLVKYSWRSYRSRYDDSYNSWKYRIDYALVSENLCDSLKISDILDLPYSDHLPVILELK